MLRIIPIKELTNTVKAFETVDPGSFLLGEKTKCAVGTKIMMNDKIKDATQDISSSYGNSEVYIPL